MRILHRYICFDKNESLLALLNELSIRYKGDDRWLGDETHLYTLEFFIYEDNPRFSIIKEKLRQFEIEPQIGTVYEKDDETNANWFYITLGGYQYPQPEDGFAYRQATFNLNNYCVNCGIGKYQNAPFRLRSMPRQHSQFWGLHWEHDAIFVRKEARFLLESENVKGISFSRPVLDKNGQAVEDLWQMHIQTELGAGVDKYNLLIETCEYVEDKETPEGIKLVHYCGRMKYNFPIRGGITINESAFQNMPDIVRSHEWFGSGGTAFQLPIVSKRVKQIIEKNKLRGLAFTPIFNDKREINPIIT